MAPTSMAPASMARHREHSTVSGGGQAGGAAVAADAAVSLPTPLCRCRCRLSPPSSPLLRRCTSSPLSAAAVVSPLPQPPWPVAADVCLPRSCGRRCRACRCHTRTGAHRAAGRTVCAACRAHAPRRLVLSDRSLCIICMHVFSLCVLMYGPFIAVWCADVQDAAQPPQRAAAPETWMSPRPHIDEVRAPWTVLRPSRSP